MQNRVYAMQWCQNKNRGYLLSIKRDTAGGGQLYMFNVYYMCEYGLYVSPPPLKRTRGLFYLLIQGSFRLDSCLFWYYSIKKVLKTPNCGIIPAEHLIFKSKKVTATGYYGIETLYKT